MAHKRKRRKKSWLKRLVFFVVAPLIIWALAFGLWLFWNPIARLLGSGDPATGRPKEARKSEGGERSTTAAEKPAKEKILDEERKELDDILKKQAR